jgi:hypothetical protein
MLFVPSGLIRPDNRREQVPKRTQKLKVHEIPASAGTGSPWLNSPIAADPNYANRDFRQKCAGVEN